MQPDYQMKLIDDIEKTIGEKYSSYKKVELYIKKWHNCIESDYRTGEEFYNFVIIHNDNKIDLLSTLHSITEETLIKIAIDLGIETPDFIPSIPTFKNKLKAEYKVASESFEKAFQQIEEHPDISVGLANSTLESILKEIIKNDAIKIKYNPNKTLYALVNDVLKEFQLFPSSDMPKEIKTIGSSLLNISKTIEGLRSDKTKFHGKVEDDYIINDSLYAYFIVNCVTTIGLFLDSFFNKIILKNSNINDGFEDNDVPF